MVMNEKNNTTTKSTESSNMSPFEVGKDRKHMDQNTKVHAATTKTKHRKHSKTSKMNESPSMEEMKVPTRMVSTERFDSSLPSPAVEKMKEKREKKESSKTNMRKNEIKSSNEIRSAERRPNNSDDELQELSVQEARRIERDDSTFYPPAERLRSLSWASDESEVSHSSQLTTESLIPYSRFNNDSRAPKPTPYSFLWVKKPPKSVFRFGGKSARMSPFGSALSTSFGRLSSLSRASFKSSKSFDAREAKRFSRASTLDDTRSARSDSGRNDEGYSLHDHTRNATSFDLPAERGSSLGKQTKGRLPALSSLFLKSKQEKKFRDTAENADATEGSASRSTKPFKTHDITPSEIRPLIAISQKARPRDESVFMVTCKTLISPEIAFKASQYLLNKLDALVPEDFEFQDTDVARIGREAILSLEDYVLGLPEYQHGEEHLFLSFAVIQENRILVCHTEGMSAVLRTLDGVLHELTSKQSRSKLRHSRGVVGKVGLATAFIGDDDTKRARATSMKEARKMKNIRHLYLFLASDEVFEVFGVEKTLSFIENGIQKGKTPNKSVKKILKKTAKHSSRKPESLAGGIISWYY